MLIPRSPVIFDDTNITRTGELFRLCHAYGMKISAEKTKLMTNNTSGINTEVKMNGQKLDLIGNLSLIHI